MGTPKKPVFLMLLFTGFILLAILILQFLEIFQFKDYISVLFPKGSIAYEQRNLLLIIQVLMLLIIVPVYVMTFIFSWKYRADNKKAHYDPDLIDHKVAEVFWWSIPLVMTLIISVLTWIKTYELDPFKPLESNKQKINIQVVALQWKWLFIYPEEKIASLNFFQIPKDTPVHFEITADAPMNSFWIPDLGGQIYAMPRMKTELHLIGNALGDFRGSSANLSGRDFADMHFIVRVSSDEDYQNWILMAKKSKENLDIKEYQNIAKPSTSPVALFRVQGNNLFEHILMKYMPVMSH